RFRDALLRRAGATVRNQNPRTSKIVLPTRSDRYGRAMAASDEAGQSRRCQCAQASYEWPVARSLAVATQQAGIQLHSRFLVPQREAPAAQLAPEFRNQAAAIRHCGGRAPVELWRSKSRGLRPQPSVGEHCKDFARQANQVRATSKTRASG